MKRKRQQKSLLIFLFVFLSLSARGQLNSTFFLMHDVPQSNFINPAVNPRCKLFIGIPFLGKVDQSYSNNAFAISELTTDDRLQLYNTYDRLGARSVISERFASYPVSVGFSYKTNYFTFAIVDRARAYLSFTRDLVGLVLHGNYQYIGSPAHFHPRADVTYFREYSAGWAFDVDEFTQLGIRGKLLFGKSNIGVGVSDITFSTLPRTFALSLDGNLSLNASFPMELELNNNNIPTGIRVNDIDPIAFILNRRNMGFGVDLGYINTWFEDITLSASVLDLGLIRWRDNLNNVSATADVEFQGIQADLDFFLNSDFEEVPRTYRDSLLNEFSWGFSNDPYITLLPTQVYLGAEYQVLKQLSAGLVIRNLFESKTVNTAVSAVAKIHVLKNLHGTLSWSYMNRSFLNIGAGLAYTGRGFQFFAVTDNAYGFFRPVDARTLNLRFGMNLMFGCYNVKELRRTEGHGMLPCPEYKNRKQNKTQEKLQKKGKHTMVPSTEPGKSEILKFKLNKR